MRIKLNGWFSLGAHSESTQLINATVVRERWTGTIDKVYVSRKKIKEMEENGFAYINKPKEFIQ